MRESFSIGVEAACGHVCIYYLVTVHVVVSRFSIGGAIGVEISVVDFGCLRLLDFVRFS